MKIKNGKIKRNDGAWVEVKKVNNNNNNNSNNNNNNNYNKNKCIGVYSNELYIANRAIIKRFKFQQLLLAQLDILSDECVVLTHW